MAETKKPMSLDDDRIHVELTEKHLDVISIMDRVRSPKAGAIVFFAGQSGLQPWIPKIRGPSRFSG